MYRALCGGVAATMLLALPAQATVFTANASTFASVFAKVKAGDTIKLTGTFGAIGLGNRTFSTPLIIDANQATFTGTLAFTNVTGLKILGGHYGSSTTMLYQAVRINKSDQITFVKPVVVGDGTSGHGIDFMASSHITVDGGTFTRLRAGIALSGVNGAILKNNVSMQAASDGFDIADSHQVKVQKNSCSDTQMTQGAHPDCVQLWSISGRPRQSDIAITDNTATGPTQGFSSFDPDAGGGLRITISGNRVDTSWSEGVACYNCDYSTFQNNVLTTQAGAKFQTRVHITGAHNTISGNSVGAYGSSPASVKSVAFRGGFDAESTSQLGDGDDTPYFESYTDVFPDYNPSMGAIPEPGIWAMLIAGFGMAGAALRRRRAAFA